MPKIVKKSRARIQQSALLPPNSTPDGLADREGWLQAACDGFVSGSQSNREIYKVILETLWPEGHGIPGPIVDRDTIRCAIDLAKGKPYHDPFRRLRELQGEEGFLGIVKQGNQYQLIDLNIHPKKQPRVHLSDDKWAIVLEHYPFLFFDATPYTRNAFLSLDISIADYIAQLSVLPTPSLSHPYVRLVLFKLLEYSIAQPQRDLKIFLPLPFANIRFICYTVLTRQGSPAGGMATESTPSPRQRLSAYTTE